MPRKTLVKYLGSKVNGGDIVPPRGESTFAVGTTLNAPRRVGVPLVSSCEMPRPARLATRPKPGPWVTELNRHDMAVLCCADGW